MKKYLKSLPVEIYIFVFFFIVNIIGVLSLETLVLSDELGTIANGAYFAGIDWSEQFATTGVNYYKYGQALIYIPLFKIFNDYSVIYKVSSAINSIFISLIPCISYQISKKILCFETKKCLCTALIIGLLPSSLLWSKFVWAETLLYFIPWCVLYLLLYAANYPELSKKRKCLISVSLGFTPTLAYMVHARGIVIVIAVFLIVIYIKVFRNKFIVHPVPYLAGVGCGILIDKICSQYLFENLWLSRSTNNSVESIIMFIKQYDLFSLTGLRSLFNLIIGGLFSVICSTYGLVLIGISVAVFSFINQIYKRERTSLNKELLYLFSGLIFIGSFVLWLVFFIPFSYELFNFGTIERFDKLIYGRYLAPAFGPLILVVLYDSLKEKANIFKKYIQSIIIIGVMIIGIFFMYLSSYSNGASVATIQISNLPIFLRESQNIVEFAPDLELHLILCGAIGVIGFIGIILFLGKKKIYLLTAVLSGSFILIYFWGIFVYYKPISDFYNDEIQKTEEVIKKSATLNNAYPYMAVLIDRGMFPYQFAFSEYKIIGEQQGLSEEYDNLLLVDNNYINRTYLLSAKFFELEEDTNVLVKGTELNSQINNLGIATSEIKTMSIFDNILLYNPEWQLCEVSEILLPSYNYTLNEPIILSEGTYNLCITVSNTEYANLGIQIEGGNQQLIGGNMVIDGDNITYTFDIAEDRDTVQLFISNLSSDDYKVDSLFLERVD